MLYILLTRLSDDGQKKMLENPDLFNNVCSDLNVPGTQLLARYGVLGEYDFVLIAEAANNESIARLSLSLGARAGLHIETLPAITANFLEMPTRENAKNEPLRSEPPKEVRG